MIGTNGTILKRQRCEGLDMTVIELFFPLRELIDGWRSMGYDIKRIGYAVAVINIFFKSNRKGRVACAWGTICSQVG
ncbi:hypothetical protein D3C74_407800 [compost metagenome]